MVMERVEFAVMRCSIEEAQLEAGNDKVKLNQLNAVKACRTALLRRWQHSMTPQRHTHITHADTHTHKPNHQKQANKQT